MSNNYAQAVKYVMRSCDIRENKWRDIISGSRVSSQSCLLRGSVENKHFRIDENTINYRGHEMIIDSYTKFDEVKVGDFIIYPLHIEWKYLKLTYTQISGSSVEILSKSIELQNKNLYVYDILDEKQIAAAIYRQNEQFYLVTIRPIQECEGTHCSWPVLCSDA